MVMKKEEFIRNYAMAIRKGNAAVFCGAGVSRSSGLADWKELLTPMAKEIGLDINKEKDLLSVAQFYENQKGRTSINNAINEAFSKDVKINTNISILTRLPITTYWTTNYDRLLEEGLREVNRRPIVKYASDQLTIINHNSDAIVYKMHGDVDNPSSIVLTKEDYESYEQRHPLFRTVLKSDLLSKVFLFIGFSFKDPNFDYILSHVHSLLGNNSINHYCFVKQVQKSEFNNYNEYEYYKLRQNLQEENLRRYGIQTVFVDSYDEITEVLLKIEKLFKLHNVFISGSAHEYAPWDQKNAEDLAAQLAGALIKEDCCITSGFGVGIGSSIINGALDAINKDKNGHIDEFLCLYPFPQNISNPQDRELRWKTYREMMISKTGVSIFMFGNKQDPDSKQVIDADGCYKEFKIAKDMKNIIIPIGSTGFVARKIWEEVHNKISDYPYLSDVIDKLGSETDIDKIINIVLQVITKQQR